MPILPEIFERQLSLETRKDPQQDTERDPFALWERMADDLDEIAANTRAGFRRAQTISALPDSVATKRGSVSKAVSGSSSQTSRQPSQPTKKVTERDKAKPAARLATGSTRGKERPGEEKDGRRKAAPSRKEDSKQTRPEQQGQTDPARKERTGGVGARQERKPVQATQTARQGGNQGIAKAIEQAANAASADRKTAAGTQTPARTKSAEAIQAIKAQKAEDKRQKGFFDRLKDAFQDASEKRYKGENEAVDMAGLAVGGPLYVAAKELKQMGESLVGEDSFLGRARESFKKSGEEKKSPGEGRQEAKDRVRDYKLRDAQGRFIKRADRATVTRDKQKIEIADESLELAYDEAREENKRHKELVKAVKSLKPGLLDRLLGRGGRGGRAGRAGKDGKDARNLPDAPDKKNKTKKGGTTPDLPDGKDKGRKDSKADIPDLPDKPDKRATVEARDSKPRRRRGILGKLGLGAGLAVGAGVAAGQMADSEADNKAAARQRIVEASAEKGVEKAVPQAATKGTVAASAAGVGGTALKGAGSLLKFLGPVAALVFAGLDAKEGFDDRELQAQAFGLKEGESASTGQKVAAAAANVLDMGGLVSGAANLLGFNLNTADMARGLYDTVSAVGNFFGQFSAGGLLDAAKSAMTTATALGTQAITGIGNFVTSMDLPGKAQAIVSAVGDLGGRAIDAVSSFFATGVSSIGDFLTGIDLPGKVEGVVSAVGDLGTKAISAVTDFISNIDVMGTLKDVATTAAEKASDIGSSIWDGITSFFAPTEAHADELTEEQKQKLERGESIVPAKPETPPPAAAKAVPAQETAKPAAEKPATQPTQETPVQASATAAVEATTTPVKTNTTPVTAPVQAPESAPLAPAPTASPAPTSAPISMDGMQQTGNVLLAALVPADRNALLAPLKVTQEISEDLIEQLTLLHKAVTSDTELRNKEYQLKLLDPATRALLGLPEDLSSVFSRLGNFGGGGGGYTGATTAVAFDPNAKLGDATAKWESGNAGVNTVAWDSTGGTSYGKWQLSAKRGSMKEYLDWMLKQGGEKAAIAQRILAAGPLETGGKTGAAVDAYKREAAANGQLLEDTQREFLFQNHYVPALNKLDPELQKRIGDSKALQEALWSTAIQHGAGGAGNIWRKVFAANPNASNEQLLQAIYAYRGTQFGSSTADVQASVRRRFAEESAMLIGMDKAETNYKRMRAAAANGGAEALAAQTSYSLMMSTQDALNRHVGYDWGGKDSRKGGIDCSGWVEEISKGMMQQINAAAGEQVFTAEDFKALDTNAAGIIKNVSEATGELITGEGLNPENVRDGMVIGMDTGDHGKDDAGRYKGIDHIVQLYRDPVTGEMMVSESRGKRGVMVSRYEDWYAEQQRKGTRLYGADIMKLGDAEKIKPTQLQAEAENAEKPATSAENAQAEQQPVQAAENAQPQAQAQPSTPAQNVQQAEAQPRPAAEQVSQYAPPTESGTNRQLDMSTVENLLKEILQVLRSNNQRIPARAEPETPKISMDFDDPAAQSLANA